MRVGIDFGTTNSAIALSDGDTVHTFKVDRQLPDLLPSLIYITKDFDEFTGTAARDTYLEKNVNRPSRYVPVVVGEITMTVGGHSGAKDITQEVVVMVDVLSPGRLLRSIKTGLRNDLFQSTNIFGEEFTLEALIAILLRDMVRGIEHRVGRPVRHAVLGRPVRFSDDPAVDARAEQRLTAAARLAGLESVTFLPEPIAAAYAYHRDFERPTRTFIFDFGGGTLDLTVAELGGDRPRVLSTAGVLIGGDDFDRRLLQSLLPHFGRGATLAGGLPFPEHVWHDLGDWQTVEELKQTEIVDVIEDAARPDGSSDPDGFRRLHALITQNLYYALLRAVEQAKIDLSSREETRLRFTSGPVDLDVPLTRRQFEILIREEFKTIEDAIDRVVTEAGLSADAIEFTVATGGSSQIPLFRDLLRRRFPNAGEASRAGRTLTGVTQGLAIYGYDLDAGEANGGPLVAADATAATDRRALIDRIRRTPYTPPPKRDRTPFSHYVIGLDEKRRLQVHPWRRADAAPAAGSADTPAAGPRRLRLTHGVVVSRQAELIVATTLSRFIRADITALHDASVTHEKTPHLLKLDAVNFEEFVLIQPWHRLGNAPYTVLVSRWGNARLFQTPLIKNPLREYGVWQLDRRGAQPDAPSRFVPARRVQTLFLLSAGGRAVHMPVRDISVRGSRGLRLKESDTVFGAAVGQRDSVLAFDSGGHVLRVRVDEVVAAGKSGKPGTALDAPPGGGRFVGLLPLDEADSAWALTSAGRLIELDLTAARTAYNFEPVAPLDRGETMIECWQ